MGTYFSFNRSADVIREEEGGEGDDLASSSAESGGGSQAKKKKRSHDCTNNDHEYELSLLHTPKKFVVCCSKVAVACLGEPIGDVFYCHFLSIIIII